LELQGQGQGPRVLERTRPWPQAWVPVRRACPLPLARKRQQACWWPGRLEGARQALSLLGPGQRREREQQELQRQESL
jgi:hypothetical protein